MTDTTEIPRRRLSAEINDRPRNREELAAIYGQVWDTAQLQEDFTVKSFLAPFIVATRKSDGVRGSLLFQHHPRFYFAFTPE